MSDRYAPLVETASDDAATETRPSRTPRATTRTSARILAVLAIGYTLHAGATFIVPIVIALLMTFLLGPVVRLLARAGIPVAAGAGIVVLVLVAAAVAIGVTVAPPAERLVADAPATLQAASTRLAGLRQTVSRVTQTAQDVERATGVASGPTTDAAETPPVAAPAAPGLESRVVGIAARVVGGAVEVVLLLYFLLAAGDLFLRKLVIVLPRIEHGLAAVRTSRAIERSLSTYLITQAALNLALGAEITIALSLLHMPSPLLWGAAAAVLAFIPYIGSLLLIGVLAVVAFGAFPDPARAAAVPIVYFVLNFLSANLVTPIVMGRRLTLYPFAILVNLAFWWAMWGIPGAFLSLPILATFKIVCDNVPSLDNVGQFIGGRSATVAAD
jgi:predicted PurR-regulated permease PerM